MLLLQFTGELRINHLPKPYTVSVGLFQMGILLQYNESTSFSAEELRERTKLEEKDWTRQIQPLIDSKMIIEVNKLNRLLSFLFPFCAI